MKNIKIFMACMLCLSMACTKDKGGDPCENYEFEFDYEFVNNAGFVQSNEIYGKYYESTMRDDGCAEEFKISATGEKWNSSNIEGGITYKERLKLKFPDRQLIVRWPNEKEVNVGPNDLLRVVYTSSNNSSDYDVSVIKGGGSNNTGNGGNNNNSGSGNKKYKCISGNCVEDADGTYSSLTACENSCNNAVACPTSVTDIHGNSYKVVQINGRCWIAQDLKVKKYSNGDPIPNLIEDKDWKTTNTGAYVFNAGKYLYNGYAAEDPRGLCPKGWRLPTTNEYQDLIDFLGGEKDAAYALKSTSGWCARNPLFNFVYYCGNGSNSSGFNAYPLTVRFEDGSYDDFDLGHGGSWWATRPSTPTAIFSLSAYALEPHGNPGRARLNWGVDVSNRGLACRCIKED